MSLGVFNMRSDLVRPYDLMQHRSSPPAVAVVELKNHCIHFHHVTACFVIEMQEAMWNAMWNAAICSDVAQHAVSTWSLGCLPSQSADRLEGQSAQRSFYHFPFASSSEWSVPLSLPLPLASSKSSQA